LAFFENGERNRLTEDVVVGADLRQFAEQRKSFRIIKAAKRRRNSAQGGAVRRNPGSAVYIDKP
jgi:hypothetical protein